MNLYLDASAWVKRYLEEDGSQTLREAMRGASRRISSRLGFVETMRAVLREVDPVLEDDVRRDWLAFDVIEVDAVVCERAVALLEEHPLLRSADAIHLASASLPFEAITVATWDRRLHAAAAAEGFLLLPERLD